MNKTEREKLRRHCDEEIAKLAGSDMPPTLAAWCLRLLDALDEALAEKEHYELLAESRGEQLDEAERKLAKAEPDALAYRRMKESVRSDIASRAVHDG